MYTKSIDYYINVLSISISYKFITNLKNLYVVVSYEIFTYQTLPYEFFCHR